MAQTHVYRNSWNLVIGLCLGVVVGAGALETLVTGLSRGSAGSLIVVVGFSVVVSGLVLRAGFAAVITSPKGIVVRNPWWTHTVKWNQVSTIDVYTPPLGPAHCRVLLTTGKRFHAYGLTAGASPRWSRELESMVAQLNAELVAHS